MKKVVYLLGAGSTQAEIDFQGIEADTMMSAISSNVYELSKKDKGKYYKLYNDFAFPPGLDIEQLMSLFQGYNKEHATYRPVYEEIRKYFRQYLISQIIGKNVGSPILTSVLHLYKNFGKLIGNEGEKLLSIMTTNYDTLTDAAFKETYGAINLGYSFKGDNIKHDENTPLLIKLHGSFNWKIEDYELHLSSDNNIKLISPDNNGWLPPSVFKKPELDLYKAIWRKAERTLAKCDVLRIVGCSLRSEDISLLSLIFTSQLKLKKNAFQIEFIDKIEALDGDVGKRSIINSVPFLANMKKYSDVESIYNGEKNNPRNPFLSWTKMLIDKVSVGDNNIYNDELLIRNLKLI